MRRAWPGDRQASPQVLARHRDRPDRRLLHLGDQRRRLRPVLPAGLRRLGQRLHLLGDGPRPGPHLQSHRRRQLRPGRDGHDRRLHRLRHRQRLRHPRPARRGHRHGPVGDRRGGDRAGADPSVRPVQPPRDRHRDAVAVPHPQRHRRRHLGLRRPRLPVAVPRPQPDLRAARGDRSSTPTCSPGSRCSSPCSSSRCCCARPRSASPSGPCRPTSSRASCSASTSGARCSSAGPSPPRSARWPARLVARTTLLEPNFMGRVLIYSLRRRHPRRPRQPRWRSHRRHHHRPRADDGRRLRRCHRLRAGAGRRRWSSSSSS